MEKSSPRSEAGNLGFPFKELMRRKFQTTLTIVSLAVCVSVATSLVLFGESLGVEVAGFSSSGLTAGFSAVFSNFILLVVLLSCVTGVLVVYSLLSAATSDRTRDIGIMKAVGCLTDAVFQHFATELLILVFAGCLIGTFVGICLNFVSTGLMEFLGFHLSIGPPNVQMVLLVFFLFAVFSFVLGLQLIGRATRVKPAEALSQISDVMAAQQSTFKLPSLFGKGLTVRISSRILRRRWSMTVRSIACLGVVMALMTVIVVGGIVAEETMLSYVQRAVGTNVVLVAKSEMAEYYEHLLDNFLQSSQTEPLNYLNASYMIPDSIISKVQGIGGVIKTDPRLILESTVKEIQYIAPDPNNPGQYIVVGDQRQGNAVFMFVHAGSLVNDWLLLGEKIQDNESNNVLLGDTLAATVFDDPFQQSFEAFGQEFHTVGVCLDPLNNGMVVYVPYEGLNNSVHCSGYNILLVQVDPSNRTGALEGIEDAISGSGLVLVDLSQSLNKQMGFVSQIWSMLLSLSLLSFISAVTSLMGFLMLSVSAQQRDLGIMRALGTKPGTILKIILFQTFLLVIAGALFGVPIGLLAVLIFLIPEPVISQNAVLAIVLLISGLTATLCLASLYPAKKAAQTPITTAVSRI
jgi:ABC-type antimicrobial peptide transport system permease subunit